MDERTIIVALVGYIFGMLTVLVLFLMLTPRKS